MPYFLRNNYHKRKTHSIIAWSFVPIFLGVIVASFLTNGTEKSLLWIDKQIDTLTYTTQSITRNISKHSFISNHSDPLEGISLKEILRGEDKYFVEEGIELPEVDAASYVVGDAITGEIIIEKNSTEVFPIASVTKLMTASVALEELNETQKTKVSTVALATEGSRGMLRANEEIEVSDLLYPLLLVSSNDASEVLAETLGRKNFIQAMNRQAAMLGMTNTSYDDPSGLSENNVSTARDLFKLAEFLYNKHETVFDITKLQEYSQGGRHWVNANKFAGTPNYEGGKTGYTSKAHRTGVALFKVPFEGYGDRVVAITILRTDNRAQDYQNILTFLQNHVRYDITSNQPDLELSSNTKVSLTFLGDIMLDRGVKSSVYSNFNGDYSKLFENLDELHTSDIVFANLEGPISDGGKNVGSKYSFRFEPLVAKVLKEAGIDVVSFANNHVGDWSLEAFTDTLTHLHNAGITFAGAGLNKQEASNVKILESHGIKVGFLAFSDVGPTWMEAQQDGAGQLLASDPERLEYIKQAKEKVDILVVSYHWGEEYSEHTQRQEELAKSSIDNGANLVIGHHPHVIQDIEEYNGGLIAYSLGNAIFDQNFSKETMEGLLLQVDISKDGLSSYEEKVFSISTKYQPQKPISQNILETQSQLQSKNNLADSLTIAWVGDIIPGNPEKDQLENHEILFEHTRDWLKDADITIANLEGNITNSSSSKCTIFSKNCFAFKADYSFADALRSAGIDMVNVANNHSFDFGKKGFSETLETLASKNIIPIGVQDEISYNNINNTTVAFVSFTHDTRLNFINDTKQIEKLVKKAKKSADIAVVILHGGAEGSEHKHTKKETEYYLNENRGNLSLAATSAIDAGADLVLGSGPHVVRGIEYYNDTPIIYSAGNFAGYDSLYLNEDSSNSLGFKITLQTNGDFLGGEVEQFNLGTNGIPKITTSESYIHSINQLSREDFGSNALVITDDKSLIYVPNRGLVQGQYIQNNPCPEPSKQTETMFLFNANPINSLKSNFTPVFLVPLPEETIHTRGRTICLQEDTANAFMAMYQDALSQGVELIPTSGFRSFNTQEYLFKNWINNHSSNYAYPAVAQAGHSEHQLGTTLDLTSPEINYASATKAFETTKSFRWLQDHAAEYGFVQSYKTGTEEITGYIPESWHWRYLSPDHALAIKNLGITTTEYLSDHVQIGG